MTLIKIFWQNKFTIGKPIHQLNPINSVLTNREKHSRSDVLLQKINKFVDWSIFFKEIKKLYKSSGRGLSSILEEYLIRILFLQYIHNLADPALEDTLIDRLSFQPFVDLSVFDEY